MSAIEATVAPGSTVRDPIADHLITPQNSGLLLIDYQPSQLEGVRSMDRGLLLKNVVSTAKIAKLFRVPIVHSTINVKTGRGKPTLPPRAEVLGDNPPIDRTTTDAWEDPEFLSAVRETGRRKLIIRRGPPSGRGTCHSGGSQAESAGVALAVELQRDWARLETVEEVVQIVLTERLLQE